MSDGMSNFILDENGDPVRCGDIGKWANWYKTAERHIGDDVVKNIRVSTVFLGVDHGWGRDRPILWETMIFGGKHDDYQERYASKQEALAGHQRALSLVNGDGEL